MVLSPSPKARVHKGKGQKRSREGHQGKASPVRKHQESFPFFPLPHGREELNSVILAGEATPALVLALAINGLCQICKFFKNLTLR